MSEPEIPDEELSDEERKAKMDEYLEEMHARKARRTRERVLKKEKAFLLQRLFWISSIVGILLFDQLTKWYVTEHFVRPGLSAGQGLGFVDWYFYTPNRLPFYGEQITSNFNLVMAWNPGVSFSMFSDYGGITPYILVGVALIIVGVFSKWMWHAQTNFHGLCYALVIGGALGNVIDRLRFHAVIDFLDFHLYGYHWPAFNVADMSIVVGIVLLIIVSLFFDIKTKQRYRKVAKKNRAFRKYLLKTFGR